MSLSELVDLDHHKHIPLLLVETIRKIGLTGNDEIDFADAEDDGDLFVVFFEVQYKDGDHYLCLRNRDLPCLVNDEDVTPHQPTILSHGDIIKIADRFIRYVGPDGSSQQVAPAKPRRSYQADVILTASNEGDTEDSLDEPIYEEILEDDYPEEFLEQLQTPQQIGNLGSSYVTREVLSHTNISLSSTETKNIFKAFQEIAAVNEKQLVGFIEDFYRQLQLHSCAVVSKSIPEPVIRVLIDLLRFSLEPLWHNVIWMRLLSAMSTIKLNVRLIVKHMGPATVMGTMAARQRNEDVQKYGCEILANVACYEPQSKEKAPIRHTGVELVVAAIRNHDSNINVIHPAMRCLATLAEVMTQMVEKIESTKYDEYLATVVLGNCQSLIRCLKKEAVPVAESVSLKFRHDSILVVETKRLLGHLSSQSYKTKRKKIVPITVQGSFNNKCLTGSILKKTIHQPHDRKKSVQFTTSTIGGSATSSDSEYENIYDKIEFKEGFQHGPGHQRSHPTYAVPGVLKSHSADHITNDDTDERDGTKQDSRNPVGILESDVGKLDCGGDTFSSAELNDNRRKSDGLTHQSVEEPDSEASFECISNSEAVGDGPKSSEGLHKDSKGDGEQPSLTSEISEPSGSHTCVSDSTEAESSKQSFDELAHQVAGQNPMDVNSECRQTVSETGSENHFKDEAATGDYNDGNLSSCIVADAGVVGNGGDAVNTIGKVVGAPSEYSSQQQYSQYDYANNGGDAGNATNHLVSGTNDYDTSQQQYGQYNYDNNYYYDYYDEEDEQPIEHSELTESMKDRRRIWGGNTDEFAYTRTVDQMLRKWKTLALQVSLLASQRNLDSSATESDGDDNDGYSSLMESVDMQPVSFLGTKGSFKKLDNVQMDSASNEAEEHREPSLSDGIVDTSNQLEKTNDNMHGERIGNIETDVQNKNDQANICSESIPRVHGEIEKENRTSFDELTASYEKIVEVSGKKPSQDDVSASPVECEKGAASLGNKQDGTTENKSSENTGDSSTLDGDDFDKMYEKNLNRTLKSSTKTIKSKLTKGLKKLRRKKGKSSPKTDILEQCDGKLQTLDLEENGAKPKVSPSISNEEYGNTPVLNEEASNAPVDSTLPIESDNSTGSDHFVTGQMASYDLKADQSDAPPNEESIRKDLSSKEAELMGSIGEYVMSRRSSLRSSFDSVTLSEVSFSEDHDDKCHILALRTLIIDHIYKLWMRNEFTKAVTLVDQPVCQVLKEMSSSSPLFNYVKQFEGCTSYLLDIDPAVVIGVVGVVSQRKHKSKLAIQTLHGAEQFLNISHKPVHIVIACTCIKALLEGPLLRKARKDEELAKGVHRKVAALLAYKRLDKKCRKTLKDLRNLTRIFILV